MLDKTVPYISVKMIKRYVRNYPKFKLPKGYGFLRYAKGYDRYWAEIVTSSGEFDAREDALRYFRKEFKNTRLLGDRCFFVKDPEGRLSATVMLWEGRDIEDILTGRLHWLSVRADAQGRGIAKALVTKLFEYNEANDIYETIYLTTQTWSYPAVNIYRTFGFERYPDAKDQDADRKAWGIISKKLDAYGKGPDDDII